ncbi:hypothetical protein AJ79_02531 [Helicocarpus griseus UAMH5409]|uniref:Cytochrome P450 monooxygenase n=1 Tax=Helicocarpus griseus UAMH5409 TaxID=1447875 RepID=A0A2B7Y126_9EURO|nr:hypothetical protein AJ79_02531 [Helicocarpus griseus UAMH5409]
MLEYTVPVAAFAVCLLLVHKYIIYPALLSPLAKIPAGHWSAHVSPLWILYLRWTSQENRTVHRLHLKYGPAIRLAPNLLSFNCFEGGLKQIYLGGFPKTEFYWNGFANYGKHNIFTFEDNAMHASRKRLISNTFSKSYVMSSQAARAATREVLFRRLLPLLDQHASAGKPLEMLEMNYSYSMDSFVHWQFGRSAASDLIRNPKERRMYLDGFFAIAPYTFWQYHFPALATWLSKFGVHLIPKKVFTLVENIEKWNAEKCDKAYALLSSSEQLSDENSPVVFAQALKTMNSPTAHTEKDQAYPMRKEIMSDMFAHNSAAHETSGNTLTYAMWELSRRPDVQEKLRQELLGLSPSLSFTRGSSTDGEVHLPEPKDVASLPYLEGVVMESLRVYPAVPGGQPRRVPKLSSLGGHDNIPAGTVVQCYAYALHRNPDVFPDPEAWKPERWIESSPEQLASMRRWFWAFGSGGRMCIGSNFANYSMKYALAAIYTNFRTEIYDHGDMELQDSYLAGPKGHRLELKFHHVS